MTGKETSLGELLAAELEPVAAGNRKTVNGFYKAMGSNDTETISRVVASDLEWWFHGPPNCQHMMRTLTGKSNPSEFKFKPRNITAFRRGMAGIGWSSSVLGARVDPRGWDHDSVAGVFRYVAHGVCYVPIPNGGGDDDHDSQVRLWQSGPKEQWDRSLPHVVLPI